MQSRKRIVLKAIFGIGGIAIASHALGQMTLYEGEGFRGRSYSTGGEVANFDGTGFNDKASSLVVERGRWGSLRGRLFPRPMCHVAGRKL